LILDQRFPNVYALGLIKSNTSPVARQRTTLRWYFLSDPFWSCIKEAVGRGVTAPVRVGGWLGMVPSLPGRGGSPLLFAFRMAPRKRKYIGQINPNCKGMKLLRAGPHK
jgi:hypothetical protein